MENFTPISGLVGGALIGIGVVVLMAFNGRVAGVSGILSGLLSPSGEGLVWRLAFIIGLIASPYLYGVLADGMPVISIPSSFSSTIVGGFLVGFGVSLGGGCTSGHGVCGIARLSPRSIIATIIFMAFGIVTVALTRHLLGEG